ncbi:MAG: hypothetical protein HAW59_04755 [Betaproteobacteria bacterium]|nr:hypothetical protein [Betaproteobacteria bacterium]
MSRVIIFGKPSDPPMKALLALCAECGAETRIFYPPPRGEMMSMAAYQSCFDDDVDFAAAGLHTAEVKQAHSHDKFLHLSSAFYSRLRFIAASLENHIKEFRPDFSLIHNGMNPTAHVVISKSVYHGVTPLFWEPPIVPGGAFILDSRAPYFLPGINSVDKEWNNKIAADTDENSGGEYVKRWRSERLSKYRARENGGEVRRLNEFLRGDAPVLFFALQIPYDMNVLTQLPREFDGDYDRWVREILRAVPDNWKVVVKKHPRTWYAPPLDKANQFAADTVDLHRLLDSCDCVLTLASNVGMEAALAGKPAIVCGNPHYANKNITVDLPLKDGIPYANILPNVLKKALAFQPEEKAINRFAARAILDYHFWPKDAEKLRATLNFARNNPADVGDFSRPFFDFWPLRLQRYARLVNEFSELGLSRPNPAKIAAHWIRRRHIAWTRSIKKKIENKNA